MKHLPVFCTPLLLLAALCVLGNCKKEYSGERHIILVAEGTLRDTLTGDCMPGTVAGTFYGGVQPGPDTAYLLVNVNVAKAGTYTIYTNTVNGYSFTGTGYFTATGLQSVKLLPRGTPATPNVTNTFAVTFDTSICTFTVNVKDSTGLKGTPATGGNDAGPPGNWRFTSPDKTVHGTGAVAVLISGGGKNELDVSGYAAGGDTTFSLKLLLSSSDIPSSGQFKTDNINTTFFLADYNGIIYEARTSSVPDILTFTMAGYNPATKEFKATFSGTVKSPNATGLVITKGSISAVLQ